MENINSFTGQFSFLSNFYETPIAFEGVEWRTVEHAYQAMKTLNMEERERIRQAETPGKAKRLGKTITLRSDWESIKVDVMLDLLRLKFSNPELKEKLLATGHAQLIEGNTWGDTFWGVDRKRGGKNTLGKLLMLVRTELILGD